MALSVDTTRTRTCRNIQAEARQVLQRERYSPVAGNPQMASDISIANDAESFLQQKKTVLCTTHS